MTNVVFKYGWFQNATKIRKQFIPLINQIPLNQKKKIKSVMAIFYIDVGQYVDQIFVLNSSF